MRGKFTMNDEKQVPLIWDFFKLYAAIFIAIVSVIFLQIPVYDFMGSGSNLCLLCIFMTQLTAFLAGLWGYQALRNSRKATHPSKWIRVCLVMNIIVAVCCFITMLFIATVLMALSLLGSLLFYVLILLTTITAFIIRGRFFLHLLTVYCLLVAHLLFWHLALEIANAV